ncbi:uncharacterized protein LOC122244055 isoform X2 [Penaeus japonicus]|uniref:uncharacterized protein LOC122244055 isoform X2 n=1 Tax=Penaeus japonicus TaxID=27405 RepID=UPI001C70BD30|nr:uncharacterized protein LOC122244055 isoform X2 [Penaeus japonicus]
MDKNTELMLKERERHPNSFPYLSPLYYLANGLHGDWRARLNCIHSSPILRRAEKMECNTKEDLMLMNHDSKEDEKKDINVNEISSSLKKIGLEGSCKRADYITWDDYFMAIAFLTAMRSKDPCSQVGACIVNTEKKIVGIGYNGMPRGCSDDVLPWNKQSEDCLQTKYMYVCHAEMNAIMNKNCTDLAGCTIYVALFPCNECAKLIIQAGIKEVIFYSDKHSHKPETIASKRMMDMAKVRYRQHVPAQKKFVLNFSATDGCQQRGNDNELHNNKSEVPLIRNINQKREDYLAWGEYFMAVASLSALRSKDPSTQVGACIVNSDNKIVSIGYNGMPRGCDDDRLPWGKASSNRLENKYMYVCHAEVNAILNKSCADVAGCTIYVALFPCNECAKIIIQSRIKEVIYLSDKYKDKPETIASKKLLDLVGISYKPYTLSCQKILIDLDSIDWNNATQLPPTPVKKGKN